MSACRSVSPVDGRRQSSSVCWDSEGGRHPKSLRAARNAQLFEAGMNLSLHATLNKPREWLSSGSGVVQQSGASITEWHCCHFCVGRNITLRWSGYQILVRNESSSNRILEVRQRAKQRLRSDIGRAVPLGINSSVGALMSLDSSTTSTASARNDASAASARNDASAASARTDPSSTSYPELRFIISITSLEYLGLNI